MSIRLKVALPYVLLTMVVSLIGVYVVTRLVTGTLQERLTNQLLESGRVVSDSFVRQESYHVSTAQLISYTTGLGEALRNEDGETASRLAEPIFGAKGIENLILISPQGNEVVHLVLDQNRQLQHVTQDTGAARTSLVASFLQSKNPNSPPRRSLGTNVWNHEVYYYTAMPVSINNEFEGVIVIGTSLRTLLPTFKNIALADIVIYGSNGQVIATTLNPGDQETLDTLAISQEKYQVVILSENLVTGDNFNLSGRNYTLGRAPLQVGSDRIGVFAVILPSDFVVQFGSSNRTTYVILFTALMLVVIGIGYLISRMIIVPLYSLVRTSQAIAGGDLNRRTGIQAKDEIGTLANTFDKMTASLQERTMELERANATLKQIDKTKTNFIQISAHELRTPLTLIMGYSQILAQDTKADPELADLSQGILSGVERMTDVVDSMLDVSRIDSDALVLKRINVEIDKVIKKVQKGLGEAFKERKIKFEVEGLEKLPSISADAELLQKVFYHLIVNAVKYTPDGGEVKVTGRYLNGGVPPQVEISVSDTGIGIDPSMQSSIFEKFHQTGEVLLHSSGKTKFKGGGPGLGLAIVRGIIQAHHGKVWVESPGHDETKCPGSTFTVSLPVDNEKREEHENR